MDKFSPEEIISKLNKATDSNSNLDSLSGRVSLKVGKQTVELGIVNSAFKILKDDQASDLNIKLSDSEFESLCNGELPLSENFIKGDFKPEGSIGSLLAFLAATES